MIAAALTALAGLVGPWAIRRWTRGGSGPLLAIAAHLASLLLAWGGLLAVLGQVVAPEHGIVHACGVMLSAVASGHGAIATTGAALAYLLLPGRGLGSIARTTWVVRRAARDLRHDGVRDGCVYRVPGLATVAITAGLVRPVVAVDSAAFEALTDEQRSVVVAHERAHARARHGLVDTLTRALAAGLAPWPGARVALAEVRRNLEAAADDRAARVHDRRTVALTIAAVATGLAPAVGGTLGASGWPVWRVQRLLHGRPAGLVRSALPAVGVTVGLALGGQATLHVLAGAHLIGLYCPSH
jgi:Zn-dependent protease with chaperone function